MCHPGQRRKGGKGSETSKEVGNLQAVEEERNMKFCWATLKPKRHRGNV